MYSNWAHLYDRIYEWKEYRDESSKLLDLIHARLPEPKTLLDVACGTAKHLEFLSEHFEVEGLDLEPKTLDVARARLPRVAFHEGDMREFDLGKRFDVVSCLFSSVGYLADADELDEAIKNMTAHLNAPGLLIIEPWIFPENWMDDHPLSAHWTDEPDIKIGRIILSKRVGNKTMLDMHIIAGTPDAIEYVTGVHEMTLFTRSEYENAFSKTGLEVEFDEEGLMGRGLFLGVEPIT
jgi:SAM-dependent methyltransferase